MRFCTVLNLLGICHYQLIEYSVSSTKFFFEVLKLFFCNMLFHWRAVCFFKLLLNCYHTWPELGWALFLGNFYKTTFSERIAISELLMTFVFLVQKNTTFWSKSCNSCWGWFFKEKLNSHGVLAAGEPFSDLCIVHSTCLGRLPAYLLFLVFLVFVSLLVSLFIIAFL